jgi:hypothetical protein
MKAHSKMSRKAFIAGLAALAAACGSDSEEENGSGTGGQAGSGTGGSGTGGSGTGGSATGGSGGSATGGAGSGGTGTGGSAGASTGGTAGAGGGNPGVCNGAITALIYANHDHELIIPLDDIVNGVEKEYMTTGTATHCHRLTVTAADFATLASGGVVTLYSCSGTNHQYVLSCGTPPTPQAPDCPSGSNLGAC